MRNPIMKRALPCVAALQLALCAGCAPPEPRRRPPVEPSSTPATSVAATAEPPCVERQLDADHDDVPDVCDWCPRNPGVNLPNHRHGRGCPYIDQFTPSAAFLFGAHVVFDKNESALSADASKTLAALAAEMKRHPHETYFVVGYTDPGEHDREPLSERRAMAVMDELVGLGVERERLTAHGAADRDPVLQTHYLKGTSAPARRVEFDVTFDDARERIWNADTQKVEFRPKPDLPCDVQDTEQLPCTTGP